MEFNELQKKRQILSSWHSFYSNSLDSLANSRYTKITKIKDNSEIRVYPYVEDIMNRHYGSSIQYSVRFKEDKVKADKLSKDIQDNQILLNKFYTNK